MSGFSNQRRARSALKVKNVGAQRVQRRSSHHYHECRQYQAPCGCRAVLVIDVHISTHTGEKPYQFAEWWEGASGSADRTSVCDTLLAFALLTLGIGLLYYCTTGQ